MHGNHGVGRIAAREEPSVSASLFHGGEGAPIVLLHGRGSSAALPAARPDPQTPASAFGVE